MNILSMQWPIMKQPTAVILNSTEMLIENVNPEKQHKILKKWSKDESKHMNNLLNQMLIYTRTTNSYQLHKQNHNLSTNCLKEDIKTLWFRIKNHYNWYWF